MKPILTFITSIIFFFLIMFALQEGIYILRYWWESTAPVVMECQEEPYVPKYHFVERGDSLWKIARTYFPEINTGEAVYMIREANPGINPGSLQIEQRIVLPQI